MEKQTKNLFLCIIILFSLCLILTSCKDKNGKENIEGDTPKASKTVKNQDKTRSSSPVIHMPKADGKKTSGNKVISIDESHTDEGYFMAGYKGNAKKAKMQVVTPKKMTYTYTFRKGMETFPLTGGAGSYEIKVFEYVAEDKYSQSYYQVMKVPKVSSYAPYLYPNQYVNFNPKTKTIQEGAKLAEGCKDDLEVVGKVYHYVVDKIEYDKTKAKNVESGYIPSVDKVLEKGSGICFDFACVMATMLRTQDIPTRLEIGYAGDIYHAWVSTYIKGVGWIDGIVHFDGKDWTLMDPTLAAASGTGNPKDYLKDNDTYTVKYVY